MPGGYSLGPAVIPLGEAASHQNRAVAIGRREIRLISEDLGLDVILTTVFDHSIVVVGKASAAELERNDLRVLYLSQRIPLAPPIGAIFVAWWDRRGSTSGSPAAHDVWAPDRRQRYLDALAAVRERGYSGAVPLPLTISNDVAQDPGLHRCTVAPRATSRARSAGSSTRSGTVKATW